MAAPERGIGGRKSREVIGVYVLDRYWVGGMADTGIMDSRGTEPGLLALLAAFIPGAVGPGEEVSWATFVIP